MPYQSGMMRKVAEGVSLSNLSAGTGTHTPRSAHSPQHCTSFPPQILIHEPCHLCLILNCADYFNPPTPISDFPLPPSSGKLCCRALAGWKSTSPQGSGRPEPRSPLAWTSLRARGKRLGSFKVRCSAKCGQAAREPARGQEPGGEVLLPPPPAPGLAGPVPSAHHATRAMRRH